MRISGITDIGCVRTENQDTFRNTVKGNKGFGLVCDGMGGPRGGKVASGYAADIIFSDVFESFDSIDCDKFKEVFAAAVTKANDKIISAATDDETYIGMGTTAVAAFVHENKCIVANVGDSRAYYFTEDKMVQISHDHSMVQELVDEGKITVDDAKNHPNRNIITRAVGAYDSVKVDFFEFDIADDGIVMLCSDGLTNMLDESEILFELDVTTNVEECAKTLVEMAKQRGGNDNITVLLISMNEEV